MWLFLHRLYGGGPELIIRQSSGASVKPVSSSPTPQQNHTTGASVPSAASSSSLSSSPSASLSSQTSSNLSAMTSHSSMPQSSVSMPSPEIASQTTSGMSQPSHSLSCPVQSYASATTNGVSDIKNLENEVVCDNLQPHSSVSTSAPSPLISSTNQEELSREESTVNQDSVEQGHQKHPVKGSEAGPSVVGPSPEINPPQLFQHMGTAREDKVKTQSQNSLGVGSALGKQAQLGDAPHLSPGGRLSTAASSVSMPTSCMSLPLLQANPSVSPETSSASQLSQSVQHEKVLFQGEVSPTSLTSGVGSPFPLAREDLKTSVESLPDSGVGTDYSCSSNDLSSLPGNLVMPAGPLSSGETESVKSNISALDAVEDDASLNLQASSLPKESKNNMASQQNAESKLLSGPVAGSTNTGKGKKKNKKAKYMDVSRV